MPKMPRVLLTVALILIAGCRLYQQKREQLARIAASTVLDLATRGHEPLTQSTFRSAAPIASPKNSSEPSSLKTADLRDRNDEAVDARAGEPTDDRFDGSGPADAIADETAVASAAPGTEITVTASPAVAVAPVPMPAVSLCSLNVSVSTAMPVVSNRIGLVPLSELAQLSKADRARIEAALREAAVAVKARKANRSEKQFDDYFQKALSQSHAAAVVQEKARRIIVIDRNGNSAEL